ncbi:hypothetical protein CGN89_24875 [Salmonella enterica]|nr:hypothetical protein [Salmonella enterica]
MKVPVLRYTDFIYSVAIKETLTGYNREVNMKGIDFGRMTPEKMGELIAAATRQLEVMNESGCLKDSIKKNLLPAIQRMKQSRHELQMVVDQMIDKTADLEKRMEQMEKVLNAIFDQDAGNGQ